MDSLILKKEKTAIKALPLIFYQKDVLTLAKELLGKWLFTDIDGALTGGIIIETEAYGGAHDRASHAYNHRRTKRTEILFHQGGVAYVHLCYGMHHMLNIVVNKKEVPEGVLIRAIDPRIGIETMKQRRGGKPNLATGPGLVTQALGITMDLYGHSVLSSPLWIEDCKTAIQPEQIITTPRIGIDYAGEDAFLPWRFLLEHVEKISYKQPL